MIVTELKKNIRFKNLNEVYLDYEYAFSLYDNELKNFNIELNGEISNKTLNEIYKKLKKNATNDSLKLLLRADYTKKMVEDKLKLKKYPPHITEGVISYLEENGFINDLDYAKHFVKSAINKGKGRKYIEFELKKRGIDHKDTHSLFLEHYKENKISEIADKKIKSIIKDKITPDFKDYKKLTDYLLRQGYSFEEVIGEIARMKGNYEN